MLLAEQLCGSAPACVPATTARSTLARSTSYTRCITLVRARADVTTHDLATSNSLRTDPPCCSARRSPAALARSWAWVCCAPLRWRPDVEAKLMALPG